MSYEMQLPDGSVVEVPDGMPPEQARQHMLHNFPDQFPARKSGFVPAMKSGYNRGVGATEDFGASLADKAGAPGIAAFLKSKGDANKTLADSQFDPTTSEDPGAMARIRQYLLEPAGGMVGAMGPSIAAGAVGSLAGPVTGAAAFMAPMAAQESGENLRRQKEAGQEPDLLKASATGLVQAALDRFGFGRALSGIGAQKLALAEAAKLAPQVLANTMTKEAAVATLGGTLKNMLIETAGNAATNTGIGVANEAMRRGQADQPLADDGALDAYKHTALSAAAISPFFGAAHGMGARGKAERVLSDAADKGVEQRDIIKREQMDYPGYEKMKADDTASAEAAQALQDQPKLLGNSPDPLVGFPDGSVGNRSQVDAYIQGLPEDQQVAARARMLGMGEQKVEPAPAPADLTSQEPRVLPPDATAEKVPDVAPPGNPNLTTPEMFADMIFPRSPTWKKGDLFGKDVTDINDLTSVLNTLKKYGKNLEDSEKNAPRIAAIDAQVEQFQAMRDNLKAQQKADKGGANVSNQVDQVHAGADAPANLGDMGVGRESPALPGQLPAAGRGRIELGPEAIAGDISGAQPLPAAVAPHAEVAPTPKEIVRAAPVPPIEPAMHNEPVPAEPVPAEPAPAVAPAVDPIAQKVPSLIEAAQQAAVPQPAEASVPVSPTAVHDAVRAGDFAGVAAALKSDTNPIIAKVGEIAGTLKGVKIEANEKASSLYNPGAKKITIADPSNTHVVAHEMVHAIMQTALDHPTKEQAPIVAGMNNLFTSVKNKLSKDAPYAIKDVHEFVAEGLSNKEFQTTLAKMKYANTTAWGRFTDYVAKLLGLKKDTALTELLSLTEQLQKTGLKAKTDMDSGPLHAPLGDYKDSAPPDADKGLLEIGARGITSAISAARKLPGSGKSAIMQKISDIAYRVEQGMFDINRGATRFFDDKATHVVNGKREASPAALLQHAPYSIQVGRESMTRGGIEKNSEGMFHVVEDKDNNFHTLAKAIEALPTGSGKDKFRVANGILTNLSYGEREAQLARRKATAAQIEAQARADIKAAQKLTGNKAAAAISKARGQLALAKTLTDADYKRPASVTDATIAQARADLAGHPEAQKMVDIVRAINLQHLTTLEQGGTISKEAADIWRQNKHYIPLQREMNEDTPLGVFSTAGGSRTKDIKSFKGSEREVQDAMGNLIRQRLYVADTAMRNDASLKALTALESAGHAGVTELQHKPQGVNNVVTVKDKGERRFFEVQDKGALRTFQGLVEQAPKFINAMEHVTRLFRETIMLSPDAIFRNVARDVTDAWAFNYTNKTLAGTAKDVVLQFAKAMPGVAREAVGGDVHRPRYEVSAYGVTGVREYTSLMREKTKIINDQMRGANPNDWAGYADRALSAAHHAWQNVATEAELATRNRVFHEVLQRTGSESEATMASINTMDFRRRGSWTAITYAKKLIPFFNSNLQGVYKLYRVLARNDGMGVDKADARKALGIKLLQMAGAASAYQAVMSDNEDYQALPKQVTDNNWVIPLGDKQYLKIPINFELGAVAFTTPTNIIRTMNGDQSGRELINALKGSVAHQMPSVIPQVVKPVLEAGFNYNSFTGKAIESEAMRKLAPQERQIDSTSDVAKAISSGDVSPVMTDHMLRGYFGSLGTFAISLVDQMLDKGNKPESPATKAPVLRSMVTDPLQSRYVDKFYELNGMTDQVATTFNKMVAQGRAEEARAYLNKEGPTGVQNAQLFALNDAMKEIGTMLSNVRKAERQIASSTMSPQEKRTKIEDLKTRVNTAVKQAMPQLSKIAGE